MKPKNKHHAARIALADVPAQLAELKVLSMKELAAKHLELFGEPTRTNHRAYLTKRLAWRIQELAEGGLSTSALARIEELGDELPVRWRMRQSQQAEVLPVTPQRDPRLPPVGSTLTRIHDGAPHQVKVLGNGFEYKGERFKSLTAVARRITNVAWNGFAFFNLKAPAGDAEATQR